MRVAQDRVAQRAVLGALIVVGGLGGAVGALITAAGVALLLS